MTLIQLSNLIIVKSEHQFRLSIVKNSIALIIQSSGLCIKKYF